MELCGIFLSLETEGAFTKAKIVLSWNTGASFPSKNCGKTPYPDQGFDRFQKFGKVSFHRQNLMVARQQIFLDPSI